jgi:hypothetical protein
MAMLDSSSTDTIIACLKDIVVALQNPSPQSPLAPLTDTHNKVLRDITQLLTNVSQPPPLAPTLTTSTEAAPKTIVEPPSLLRVDSPSTNEATIVKPPSVLRVASPSTNQPTPAPATEQPAPPLRVPNPTAKVRFDPSTKPPAPTTSELTYADVTGLKGKQRRKSHRKKTKVFPTIATAKTVLAKIKKLNRKHASKVLDVETALPSGTITHNRKQPRPTGTCPPQGSGPVPAPTPVDSRSQKSRRRNERTARRAQDPSQ